MLVIEYKRVILPSLASSIRKIDKFFFSLPREISPERDKSSGDRPNLIFLLFYRFDIFPPRLYIFNLSKLYARNKKPRGIYEISTCKIRALNYLISAFVQHCVIRVLHKKLQCPLFLHSSTIPNVAFTLVPLMFCLRPTHPYRIY